MLLVPGTMITPELRLTHQLGAGAMGMIWAGEHLRLGRRVAVKFISAELLATNPQARERFDREAMVLTGFRHRHVVELIGNGSTSDGTPYIVLELMEGEVLIDRLERDGVFELQDLRWVIDQLCDALESLHSRGVIHRDIKAENVFISGSGPDLKVKLFDFGLARFSADSTTQLLKKLTAAGMRVGTNEYMSPEQMLSAADANHTADLWAVTVVAYLLLVAGFPFRAKKIAELYTLVSLREFERPSAVRDDVPAAIDRWFEQAFHPHEDQRFTSARQLAAGFRAALAGQPATEPAVMPIMHSGSLPPFSAPAPSAKYLPPSSAAFAPAAAPYPPPSTGYAPPQSATFAPPTSAQLPAAALAPITLPFAASAQAEPTRARSTALWVALGVVALIVLAFVAVRFLA